MAMLSTILAFLSIALGAIGISKNIFLFAARSIMTQIQFNMNAYYHSAVCSAWLCIFSALLRKLALSCIVGMSSMFSLVDPAQFSYLMMQLIICIQFL